MEGRPCTVSALGRIGSLGEFYNIKTDELCGSNIFATNPSPSSIQLIDSHYTDLKYIQGDSFDEKCHHLDVNAELKLSVLVGLLKLGGSGKYLSDKKETSRTSSCTLLYNIKTVLEKINVFDPSLRPLFSKDALQLGSSSGATHIVTEIQWGANSMVTFDSKEESASEITKAEGKLEAELKKLNVGLSGTGAVNYEDSEISKMQNLSFKVFGDIIPNDNLPQNLEQALNYLKSVPKNARAANNGKGVPLVYTLFPVGIIKMYLQLEVQTPQLVQSISEAYTRNFVQLIESIANIKQQLQSLKKDIQEFEFAISFEDKAAVNNLYQQVEIYESNMKEKLKITIIKVRECSEETTELEKVYTDCLSDSSAPTKIALQLVDLTSSITESMSFAKILLKEGAQFLSSIDSVENKVLAATKDTNVFLLSTNRQSKSTGTTVPDSALHRRVFVALCRNCKKQCLDEEFYVLVSNSVREASSAPDSISHYKNGKCLTNNYVEVSSNMGLLCIANTSNFIQPSSKPNKRIIAELPCPSSNNGICKTGVHIWRCGRCKANLEFGFDNYFYCDCGKALANSFSYKCDDIENHGFGFEVFDATFLQTLLDKFRPLKEKNILILGETGVGKSTWINGFVNYLTYPSLEIAAASESVALIPSTFTMTDSDGKSVKISTKSTDSRFKSIGTDDDENECHTTGASATQFPKSYVFPHSDTLIRIIDTPGIGDTRGIEYDKKNFENIMNHISHLAEIHGICILLKPNNARLNVVFRFCIQELLTHLHKAAAKNIVFCFTNARSTSYRPGDTKPALDVLLAENSKQVDLSLSKHTMYCFDNESVRFLAAVQNGISFNDKETENYSCSWIQSVEETTRLLKHINELPPHATESTITLNHARSLILALTEPIGQIAKNIEESIAVVEEHEKNLSLSTHQKDSYEKDLYIPGVELVEEKIEYPITVCASSKCSKSHTNPDGKTTTIEYVQHCHERCYLKVPAGSYPQPGLIKCWAMKRNIWSIFMGTSLENLLQIFSAKNSEIPLKCRICGCSWSSHLHITYKLKRVDTKVKDFATVLHLSKTTSRMEKVCIVIEKCRKQIEDLKSEREIIAEVSSKFAAFLKTNAITPYNDALINYLEHLIKLEEAKIQRGVDNHALNGLQGMKRTYQHQVEILEAALRTNATVLEPNEIEPEIQRLYKLPTKGKMLELLVQIVKSASSRNFSYHEQIYMPRNGYAGMFKNQKGNNAGMFNSNQGRPNAPQLATYSNLGVGASTHAAQLLPYNSGAIRDASHLVLSNPKQAKRSWSNWKFF